MEARTDGSWTDVDRAMFELAPPDRSVFESLEVHRGMLSDREVVQAFRAALRDLVEPGSRVIDLGAGLGVLAFLSFEAGASMVYAIERNRSLELAKRLARANSLDGRIVFVSESSTQLHSPPNVNIVVSQTLGHLGFEEDILTSMIDARERMLVPQGHLIPASIELYLVPATSEHVHQALSFWTSQSYGIDLSTLATHAMNNIYVVDIDRDELFAQPKPIYAADLYRVTDPNFSGSTSFQVDRSGTIRGLAGWFRAQLTPDIAIDTSPYSRRTHWRQCYLPLSRPVEVSAGDEVEVSVRMTATSSKDPTWSWGVRAAADEVTDMQSTADSW